jgi:hypothetical protein
MAAGKDRQHLQGSFLTTPEDFPKTSIKLLCGHVFRGFLLTKHKETKMSEESGQAGGNEGGGTGDDRAWLSSIPENLRAHEAFKEVKTLPEVYQGFADLKVRSKDMVAIPGENSTDEEKTAFFTRLGRPEAAEKYTITRPEGVPENLYTPEVAEAMKGIFFKANLSDAQAQVINTEYSSMIKQGEELRIQTEKEATEKAINALKDEWKGDTFKENTEIAARAFKQFGGDEGQSFLEETKINGVSLGDHPQFLKIFFAIGKAISDDSAFSGRGGLKGEMSEEDKAKARFPATYKK